jgi:hypothetical protein
VRATIRHGNVDVFRELLPPQLLFTGLAVFPSFGLIVGALPDFIDFDSPIWPTISLS